MNTIKAKAICRQIEDIINKLERMERAREEQLKKLPQGELQIHRNGKGYSCYQCVDKVKKSIKKNSDIASMLATKHFIELRWISLKEYRKSLKVLEKQLKKLEKFHITQSFQGTDMMRTFQGMNSMQSFKGTNRMQTFQGTGISERGAVQHARVVELYPKKRVEFAPDEKKWVETPYRKSNYRPDECTYITPRGVRVRTKSEYIIACFLEKYGIPYRYEPEVWTPHKTYYPDFEIYLAPGVTVYWEHMGLAGVEEYDSHNIEKLRDYNAAGINTRKNLIITFEEDIASEEKLMEILVHAYSRRG